MDKESDDNSDELLINDDGSTEDNPTENVPENVNEEASKEVNGDSENNAEIGSSKEVEEKIEDELSENTVEKENEAETDLKEDLNRIGSGESKKRSSEESSEDEPEVKRVKVDEEETEAEEQKDDTEYTKDPASESDKKCDIAELTESGKSTEHEQTANAEDGADVSEVKATCGDSEDLEESKEIEKPSDTEESDSKITTEGDLPMETSDERELPTETSDERELPTETSDERELPTETSDERELPTETSDERELPTETSDERELPTETSDEHELPTETSDERELPTETSDERELPTEACEDKSDDAILDSEKTSTPEKMDEPENLSMSKPVLPVNGKMEDDDNSTVRSDDSEKENINADLPMDLSTKSSATSDIITLSDDSSDEDGKMNGFTCSIPEEMTPEQKRIRRKLVKKLQAELRNEEAKLVLLKKMRQSQASQQLQDHSNFNGKQAPMKAHAGQPPPLIRGGQSAGMPVKSQNNSSMSSQLMRGQHQQYHMRAQMQGPPPLVMAPRMANHMMQPQGLRGGLPPGATPNLLPGFRGQLHQQAQAHSQQLAQQQQETQTPAQRQAAAKLALRKQLEKTLLQIPPPKPPPPEMNFIPSLISNEFIMLVGLEEVVNYITDADLIARGEKSPDEKLVCTPFTCIQCDTDFTPVWKREKPGSKHVICEMCVTTNQKKALKQEHTNRLKSAFVKALQQEQEIERMQSHSSSTPTTTPVAASPVTTSSNMSASSYKSPAHAVAAAAEQLRHHQNLLQAHQAHQAHLRANQPLGLPTYNPRNPFHYQLPFKHTDLQRQYLLDMIPSRSMAQSNIGWKS